MTDLTPSEVIAFLNGEAALEGRWFGDDTPRGNFWWRKYLPVLTPPDAVEAQPHSPTFLAENAQNSLTAADAGEVRAYREGVREQVARDIWAAEYDEDLPADGTIQHAMAMQMADAAIAAIRKLL